MFHHLPAAALAAVAGLAALTASAQTPPPRPESPAGYRSALEGYQPFAQEKLAPWKDANDTVGRIGGWRVYAKEAQEGTPIAPATEPARPAESAPRAGGSAAPANPHAGHGKP